MKSFISRSFFLYVALGFSVASQAQMPMGSKGAAGMNSAMNKLFAGNTNFIAHAEVRVLDKNHKETTTMPMKFDMLGNKTRLDIKMSDVKSREMSPQFTAMMKKMGIDEMITLMLPDQKVVVSIYPGVQSYAQTVMSKDELDSAAKDPKVTRTLVGKETIDGHACEKYNVTLTDDKGVAQQALTWNALDLKGFPVQIQVAEEESTLIMKFKDIKLGRPDPSLFAVPAGMTKFESVNALMTDAATKSLNPGKSH